MRARTGVACLVATLAGCASHDGATSTWVALRVARDEVFDHEPIALEAELFEEPGPDDVPLAELLDVGFVRVSARGRDGPPYRFRWPDVCHTWSDGADYGLRKRTAGLERALHRGEPTRFPLDAGFSCGSAGEWDLTLAVPRIRGARPASSGEADRVVASVRVRVVEQPLVLPETTPPGLRAALEDRLRLLRDHRPMTEEEARAWLEEVHGGRGDCPPALARALEAAPDEVWEAAFRLFALRPTLAGAVADLGLHRHDALLLSGVSPDGGPLDDLLQDAVRDRGREASGARRE